MKVKYIRLLDGLLSCIEDKYETHTTPYAQRNDKTQEHLLLLGQSFVLHCEKTPHKQAVYQFPFYAYF